MSPGGRLPRGDAPRRPRVPHSRDETIRAAVSGGSLTQIFTTSVNAMLLRAYDEEPDTTVWVEEGEVADFKTNTAIRFNANAGLKKLGARQVRRARHRRRLGRDVQGRALRQAIRRDEQDIIDDSMNALSDIPGSLAWRTARLRPDLVYAMVLANPTMADTGTVFNSTALTTAGGHANYAAAGTDILGGALSANSAAAGDHRDAQAVPRHRPQQGAAQHRAGVPARPAGSPVHRRDPAHQRRALQGQRRRQFNPLKGKLTSPVVEPAWAPSA
jgi:hypothetical protein